MSSIVARHTLGDRFEIDVRGHRIVVDQPDGPWGRDEGPTPTELFVAGLTSCVGFYAGRFLRRHDLPIDGLVVSCSFEMSADRPSRVRSVDLDVETGANLTAGNLEALRRVVDRCTVHNSIRMPPEVRISVTAARRVA